MELPPALRPWAPWVGELVPELHAALLDAVTALERAVGPLPPLPDPGAVEPSGLDGLRRRGPYERLLLSEWVLADEVPDEFLRRAAAGEHLFHELARIAPQRGRRCLVLVDTGREQLGAPRLAQLALLVVFARRAARAGATFGWTSLQRPAPLDDTQLRAFSGLRSPRAPTPADLDAALDALGRPGPDDEVFVVGGPAATALAGRYPTVAITEALDDGPDRLRITVRRAGLAPVARDLPLPDAALATRWIRDPFRAASPPPGGPPPRAPHRARPAGTWASLRPFLRFSADGNRVLAVDDDGTALGFRLPQGGAPVTGPVRIAPPTAGARVAAIGWAGGRLQALFAAKEGPVWRGGRAWWEKWTPPLPPIGDEPGEVLTWVQRGAPGAWFRMPDGTLYEWKAGRFDARSSTCLALGRRDGRRFFVDRLPDGRVRWVQVDGAGATTEGVAPGPAERAVVGSSAPAGVGHVVLESATAWATLSPDPTAPPCPRPAGALLVGAPATWERTTPTSGEQRRGVLFVERGTVRRRWVWPPRGDETLAHGVLAAAGGTLHWSRQVAWIEPPATVVVADLDGRVLARWEPA